MITVKLLNGNVYQAESYEKIVLKIKDSTPLQENKIDYMEGTARRTRICSGMEISYSSAEEFIHELERAEILEVL